MVCGSIDGWVAAAAAFLWANREAFLKAAAEAVALAEKSRSEGVSDRQLEEIAVRAFRQVKALRWVPEAFVRMAIRQVCARRKRQIRRMADEPGNSTE